MIYAGEDAECRGTRRNVVISELRIGRRMYKSEVVGYIQKVNRNVRTRIVQEISGIAKKA